MSGPSLRTRPRPRGSSRRISLPACWTSISVSARGRLAETLVHRVETDEQAATAVTARVIRYDCTVTAAKVTHVKTQSVPGAGAYTYPMTAIITPKPSGDWVGTDETGYTSAKLNARIMPITEDGKGPWWARIGEEWITITDPESPDYGAQVEYPSARMAREQVE